MGKNPLSNGNGGGHFTSKISAKQWAQMARDKNLMSHAVAWEKAYREGWDELHYRPDVEG
jgi:hypothetical protein